MNELREHLAPIWSRPLKIEEIERGKGMYLYDTNGRRYLDFTAGIAVTSTGHCHPKVVRAIQEQASMLLHGQVTMMYTRPLLNLMEELIRVLPSEIEGFFFGNSGSEAVEGALKLARQVTGRHGIIAFKGGFHGRTYGSMSVTTSNALYRTGYAPLLTSVYLAPYPHPFRWALRTGAPPERCLDACLCELEDLFVTQIPANEVAGVIVESVLGEGGYVIPPTGFLHSLREITQKHGILLILDEVQTGFGRTGKMFGFEHEGITPDIVIMAKALGSGLPISAVGARKEIMGAWVKGTHGSTYGANPVACAAATETIRVIREENLVGNAHEMGLLLLKGLEELTVGDSGVGEVRGLGLMVALEFVQEQSKPALKRASHFMRTAWNEGLLVGTCGPHSNIIRYMPPLIVNEREIEEALRVTGLALEKSREQRDRKKEVSV
jgi:4-aminobutyrate aminotransferase